MSTNIKNAIRLSLLLLSMLLSTQTFAKKDSNGHNASGRNQGRGSSNVQQMEQDTGGTVLGSERIERDGVPYQKMKILLPGGKVKTVYEPAR